MALHRWQKLKKYRRVEMNVYYAKTALYAYPNLRAVADQIDELVERKALFSINDYSPAIEQCEKIVDFTFQKDVLFALKLRIEEIFNKLSDDEKDCIEYKYFKRKPKEYFKDFDFESRAYFRKQIKIAKKVAEKLEKGGATDKWFEENCLTMDFFKELLKRVIEHENNCRKNPKKSVKALRNESLAKRMTA